MATALTLDAYMRLDPLYSDMSLYFSGRGAILAGARFDEAVIALKQRLERISQFSDVLRSACIVLRSPRQNCRKPGGLGGRHENFPEFLNRAATAHPAV